MLELFTERGRRVIALAQDLAPQHGHRTMSVDHLLAAVLRVDGGQPARTALGVSEAQTQRVPTSFIGDSRVGVARSIRPAPDAKRVMADAALQAGKADSKADVSHLLVQLLLIDDANVDRMLTALGVDRDEAHRRARDQSAADERRLHARLPRSEDR
ncbi:Clp protease N-terminal domain-containing protein [uncultured Jatrophihabitans sp.]|uniref:Clp protease N-terminal domain-containing protein n=1 Tax=uncultured Jatrophihabitans sp. TaxID=1610747 RepID=UPI0035CB8E19